MEGCREDDLASPPKAIVLVNRPLLRLTGGAAGALHGTTSTEQPDFPSQ